MRAALVDLAGETALDHGDEPLGADVRRRADRAGAAHEHEREEERVLATEHREVVGRAGEQLERVEVEAGRGLLDPDDVRVRRRPRARRRRRGCDRCGSRCCRARPGPGDASATARKCATMPASDGRT